MLAQIYGQHMNAFDCVANDGTIAAPMLRPVGVTGQTGRRCGTATTEERLPGRDPVRAGVRRVVLGSAGHLERLQTS